MTIAHPLCLQLILKTHKYGGNLMDKELLRTGLIIMVAMIISAYLKDQQNQDEYEYDEDEYDDEDDDDEDDKEEKLESKCDKHNGKIDDALRPTTTAPSIIQFSVITKGNDDFNVADVFDVLEGLGLEYGSLQIFERIDEQRLVQFGVASLVEPGTFPNIDLEKYYCPGVVFFMQVDGLENPENVFKDYVATAALFADYMDGVVLDHRRQPLTNEMVDAISRSLEHY